MIQTETYGAGVRWHCTRCDELYSEGRLTVHYTNSPPPKECKRCDEEAMLVIWGQDRPNFVSIAMTRREAAELNRMMHEGVIVSVERGRELKRQMVNGVA